MSVSDWFFPLIIFQLVSSLKPLLVIIIGAWLTLHGIVSWCICIKDSFDLRLLAISPFVLPLQDISCHERHLKGTLWDDWFYGWMLHVPSWIFLIITFCSLFSCFLSFWRDSLLFSLYPLLYQVNFSHQSPVFGMSEELPAVENAATQSKTTLMHTFQWEFLFSNRNAESHL